MLGATLRTTRRLLGHDRVKPADLRRSGRRQLEEHANVEVGHGAVEDVEPTGDLDHLTYSCS
jgi:hypothetical protein